MVESQKSLLANASHELRSPLARLRMATEMFTLEPRDSARAEIVRNLGELDELVEEILLKSRLGSNQPLVLDQHVDLLALAAEEAAAVDGEVEDGDAALLERAVDNLLSNAIKFSGEGGVIEVLVAREDTQAVITVRDHGDGLKPEEMSRIFEPFFRPEGRSESAGGWGLGLALVSEIAQLHGGRAYAAHADDAGACFVVEISRKALGRFV